MWTYKIFKDYFSFCLLSLFPNPPPPSSSSGPQYRWCSSVCGYCHSSDHVPGYLCRRGALHLQEEPPRLWLRHHWFLRPQWRLPASQHQDCAQRWGTGDIRVCLSVHMYECVSVCTCFMSCFQMHTSFPVFYFTWEWASQHQMAQGLGVIGIFLILVTIKYLSFTTDTKMLFFVM